MDTSVGAEIENQKLMMKFGSSQGCKLNQFGSNWYKGAVFCFFIDVETLKKLRMKMITPPTSFPSTFLYSAKILDW